MLVEVEIDDMSMTYRDVGLKVRASLRATLEIDDTMNPRVLVEEGCEDRVRSGIDGRSLNPEEALDAAASVLEECRGVRMVVALSLTLITPDGTRMHYEMR